MAAPANGRRIRIGRFEFDPATGELTNGEHTAKLQSQPVRVLNLLASRPGELVTRDELRHAVWPEGTSVEFDQGLNFCIRQIRAAFGESASAPEYLETLPKRGYRLIAPVTPADPDPAPPPVIVEPDPPPPSRRWPLLGAALCVLLLPLAFWLWSHGGSPPRSILVRPFLCLGLPPDQNWYGDAITQQLIAALTQTRDVRVLPWSTSLALKGLTVDARELGRRFGADLILEGSLRPAGDKARLTVQIVDARSGGTVWSHPMELDATDLATIDSEFIRQLARTLQLRIQEPALPADRETYNLYRKAVFMHESGSHVAESAAAFAEVIRRAPRFAPAYIGLANCWARESAARPGPRKETLLLALAHARKAVELDPTLAEAHTAVAHVSFVLRRWAEAEKEFHRALSLDPDSAETLQIYAIYLAVQGRFDEALRRTEQASRLAPTSGLIYYTQSLIEFHAGKFDQSIATARRALEFDISTHRVYLVMSRAYAMKGSVREAFEAHAELERKSGKRLPLWRAYLLARAGDHAAAREELRRWDEAHPDDPPQFPYTLTLLEFGDTDRGFRMLATPDPGAEGVKIWIRQTPELQKWRDDPRYRAVADSITYPPTD